METEEKYGMYIDESDGLPRWIVPPIKGHRPERAAILRKAVNEYYADYGRVWLVSRIDGCGVSKSVISHYARIEEIGLSKEGRARLSKFKSEAVKKLYRMERIRYFSGMKQRTNMKLSTVGPKVYEMRHNLIRKNHYKSSALPVLLYDENTKRRNDEDALEKKYGIRFKAYDSDRS